MLRRVKSQSQILTLSTEFVTYQTELPASNQTSPESESLDEGDLSLLGGEASPEA